MDGVLADFDLAFYERSCELVGESPFAFGDDPSKQAHRFMTDDIKPEFSHLRNKLRAQVEQEGWFLDLPEIEGAVEGMDRLIEFARVWICTKPLESNPWCRDEKAKWIRQKMGTYWETRLILAPDKSLIRGRLLLDDAIKPHWVPDSEWEPVVFPAPFNAPGTTHGADWRRWDWSMDPEELVAS